MRQTQITILFYVNSKSLVKTDMQQQRITSDSSLSFKIPSQQMPPEGTWSEQNSDMVTVFAVMPRHEAKSTN